MTMMQPPSAGTKDMPDPAMTPAGEAAPPRPRRRRLLWGAAALALAAGVAGAVLLEGLGEAGRAAGHAPPDGGAALSARGEAGPGFRLAEAEMRALRVEPATLRDFRTEHVAEGRISYNEDRATPVFPPYTGRVLRVLVRLGDQVEAGQPLLEIETTDLVQAANDLLAALDGAAKARTTLDLARRNEARQRELVQARAAARRDLEQAEAEAANAAADLRVAEASLAAARDRLRVLGRTPEEIARIERTRRVEAVATVAAPIAGTVVQRRVGPGQWLAAGAAEPVLTIADLSTMWLVAAVRERDAPAIRPGQPVEVRVEALPGRRFEARIATVGAALDPATRRLPVRAEVQDPEGLLKPEMFATFRILVGEEGSSVALPASAVIHRGEEASVWVALDGNRFEMRRVRLGRRAEGMVEVTEGLAPGSRVVTGGALFIDRAARAD
ncbi:efflux RND transporter periplasmic adaptor subunit [Crenalkalicoccus roseus]|uniref:efflux RND transporter periplasmic adaptor subunit n=1 Tax=Crenalkalicoccus roseus TaxID=1485588 RepID=UPI0010810A79|nr:efflux RND transporter periplasmic adaptor subunit [Crenalkalicoccus roseus]